MSVHTVHSDNPHRHLRRLRPRDCRGAAAAPKQTTPHSTVGRSRTRSVLVYLLRSVWSARICAPANSRQSRRYVKIGASSRRSFARAPISRRPNVRELRASADFAKLLVVGVRAWWNVSDRAVCVCVCMRVCVCECVDLWAILKMSDRPLIARAAREFGETRSLMVAGPRRSHFDRHGIIFELIVLTKGSERFINPGDPVTPRASSR